METNILSCNLGFRKSRWFFSNFNSFHHLNKPCSDFYTQTRTSFFFITLWLLQCFSLCQPYTIQTRTLSWIALLARQRNANSAISVNLFLTMHGNEFPAFFSDSGHIFTFASINVPIKCFESCFLS